MSILNKIKSSLFDSEEYVIQINDGIGWNDIGVVEEVLDPDEYDLPEDGRSRLVCRKGDKIKNIVWTNGNNRKPAPERKARQKKQRSAVEEIQLKADRIKRDRDKLIDIKESLGDILGIDDGGAPEAHEEWQYPSMATGLNRGIGHAFLMGMDEKKGDIAQAGLEMVRGFSGVMSAIPVLAVAYAKSKGVNVGLFGMDENMLAGQQQQAPSPSPQVDSKAMKERRNGFDVDTIDEDEYYDEGDEYESDDINNESNKASDIDLSLSDNAVHEFTIDKRNGKESDIEPEDFNAIKSEESDKTEEVINEPGEVINETEEVDIGNDQLSDNIEHDETPVKIIHSEDELPDDIPYANPDVEAYVESHKNDVIPDGDEEEEVE